MSQTAVRQILPLSKSGSVSKTQPTN